MGQSLELSVVTPERSIVSNLAVEAVVLPASSGQATVLPGHINYLTTLKLGSFGYKVGSEWHVAFLSGGFAQVYAGKATVLAETLETSHEIDVAAAELELQNLQDKLKGLSAASAEYGSLSARRDFALAKLKAAQKKIH